MNMNWLHGEAWFICALLFDHTVDSCHGCWTMTRVTVLSKAYSKGS